MTFHSFLTSAQLFDLSRGVSPLPCFPEKAALELGIHRLRLESAAENVSFFRRHAGHAVGDLHHLLLVEEKASCLGKYSTQETIP